MLRGRGIKARLLHPYDAAWDLRLGVHTFGHIPAVHEFGHPRWQGHYQATPYRDIVSVLRHVGLGADDVFVDLGCGLGRTVFVANRLGARRAVGVEIDERLAAQCRADALRRRHRGGEVEFVCGPAEDYANADTTVLFMFHPFGAGTMKAVIDRLDAQLNERPRPFRLVYLNPVYDDVVATSTRLRRVDHWPERRHLPTASGHSPVSFWRSCAPESAPAESPLGRATA